MFPTSLHRRFFLTAGACSLLLPKAGRAETRKREIEGGLGGTGIVGILVDFGSLVLAGQIVETDDKTRVSSRFGPMSEDQLALGDALTIEAATRRDGTLVARRIEVTWPLVGAITERDLGGQRLVVNGVTIRTIGLRHGFGIGDRVAVAGLWRGGDVIASRISPAPSRFDLVSGTIGRKAGRRAIGGVPLRRSAASLANSGRYATAIGRFDPASGVLTPRDTLFDRFTGAAGPLKTLAIEGWLEPDRGAPGFRISGLGHSFERNLNLARFQDQRMLFLGPYQGRFAANRVVRLPDDEGARRRLLRQIIR